MSASTSETKAVFDTEKYLKNSSRCMFCGSSNIEGGFVDIDGRVAAQPVRCECGAHWQDIYELKEVDDVHAPDGTFIGS